MQSLPESRVTGGHRRGARLADMTCALKKLNVFKMNAGLMQDLDHNLNMMKGRQDSVISVIQRFKNLTGGYLCSISSLE